MNFDVAIVGAGVMGSAVAWFLTREPSFRGSVALIERDTTFRSASSALSASGIRQQFSTPVSAAMSQFGWSFISSAQTTLGCDLGLLERGYLLLGNEHCPTPFVTQLDQRALARRFPWLQVADLDSATWCEHAEGWFDGPGLHQTLYRAAQTAGVEVIRRNARGFRTDSGRVISLILDDGEALTADLYVNAAGAWSAALMPVGLPLPIEARKRDVFVFSTPKAPKNLPMIWDPSGLWFRPEGRHFICGCAPAAANDPAGAALEPDYQRFDDELWPALAYRVPAFEQLRLHSAWSGYYEHCTFDQNGFVGPVDGCDNLLLACGFSGHGMQHAPAVGRAVAEWICHGDYRSIDLSPLHHHRIAADQPIVENQVA